MREWIHIWSIDEGRLAQAGNQSENRTTKAAFTGSDDDISSLEESVEEHKQPQTEEIMNAELAARVNLFRIFLVRVHFDKKNYLYIITFVPPPPLFLLVPLWLFFYRKEHRKQLSLVELALHYLQLKPPKSLKRQPSKLSFKMPVDYDTTRKKKSKIWLQAVLGPLPLYLQLIKYCRSVNI